MKEDELIEEIRHAAESIKGHADYLENQVDSEDMDGFNEDGEGTYEMRVTLSVTSHERGRNQAEQHCRKVAGSLRRDSAVGRFDIANTSVRKLDRDGE